MRIALVALGCVACGPTGPATVEVGTGTTAFEAIAPGSEVRMVCGPQGGQHVWTSVRATEVETDNVSISLEIFRGSERVCGTSLAGVRLVEGAGGAAFSGVACFIADPAALDGVTVTLKGSVRDEAGRGGEAEVSFIALAPAMACHR